MGAKLFKKKSDKNCHTPSISGEIFGLFRPASMLLVSRNSATLCLLSLILKCLRF